MFCIIFDVAIYGLIQQVLQISQHNLTMKAQKRVIFFKAERETALILALGLKAEPVYQLTQVIIVCILYYITVT